MKYGHPKSFGGEVGFKFDFQGGVFDRERAYAWLWLDRAGCNFEPVLELEIQGEVIESDD